MATLIPVNPGFAFSASNISHVGSPPALDASTATYVEANDATGGEGWQQTLTASGAGATDLVECTLACDAIQGTGVGLFQRGMQVKSLVFGDSQVPGALGLKWGLDSQYAVAFTAMSPNTGYTATARLKRADADALVCVGVKALNKNTPMRWNNLRVLTVNLTAPATTAVGPTGTVAGNNPVVSWSTSASPQEGWEVRIYPSAVYLLGGFSPDDPSFPATYVVSSSRPAPGSGSTAVGTWSNTSVRVAVPLQIGTYRAYIRTAKGGFTPMPGEWLHWSTWSFVGFSIIDAPSAPAGPRIPGNIVASLPFPQFLTQSHQATAQAVLFSPDGSSSAVLNLVSGSVRYDGNQKIRATASFEVADVDMVPWSKVPFQAGRFLHPFGSYVHLARGIGDSLVGLGVFRIDEVRVSKSTTPQTVRVTASDFSAHLDDSRFAFSTTRQDWSTNPPTQPLVTAVAASIVAEAGLAFRLSGSSAAAIAANYVNKQTESRVDALRVLADQLDWVTYADDDGVIFFGTPRSTATAFLSLAEADLKTLATSADFTLSRKDVFDLAVAYDQTGTYIATAFDSNPDSPIRRSNATILAPVSGAGPFSPGGKPKFFASPLITSTPVAAATAKTVLLNSAQLLDPIPLKAIPHPGLRPGHGVDVVLYGDTVSTRMVVQQVVIPLDAATEMQVVVSGLGTFVTPSN